MSKARDLANAGTALGAVTATELGYVDGVTSAIQTQIDSKEATLPSQTGNSGKYLTTNGTAKSWGTVSQYALPTQTGNSGKFLTTNGTAESWGSAGLTFNGYKAATNATSNGYGAQRFFGKLNGYYIILTDQGFIFYSSDMKTWTRWASTASEATVGWQGAAYGAGVWIFFGDSGYLYSASTIGGTLTSRTSTFGGETINAGCFTAGSINLFTIVGGNGYTASSPDGITWTARTSGQGTSQIPTVATNGTTHIVLIANGSAVANASYSTNGTTWTTVSPDAGSASSSVKQVFWDPTNSYFVFQRTMTVAYYVTIANIASTWTLIDGTLIGAYNSDITRDAVQYDFRTYDSSRSSFFTFSAQAGTAQITEYDLTQSYVPRTGYINYKVKNTYTISYPIGVSTLPGSQQVGYGYADGLHNLCGTAGTFMLSTAV
jgi:hypothetical protein